MSNLPLPLAAFAAFVAGLVSFLSPCVLPLVPGYVSLISGAGVEELKSSDGRLLRKVLMNSAAFILGFSIVFITLGAAATEVGTWLRYYQTIIARVAGVIIILFGLHLTGIFQIKALLADTRLHSLKGGSSPGGAFVIGFAFAFGWTPCVGPILGVVLGFASAQDTVSKGIFLLTVYSAGLAVPFFLTSLGIERFLKFYNRFKFHMHAVEVASGVLLILLGILLVAGRFTLVAGYFSFLNRFESDWQQRFLADPSLVQKALFISLIAAALIVVLLVARFRPARQTAIDTATNHASRRNPLILFFVAVVVALMLFAGIHATRNHRTAGPANGQLVGNLAPDFELSALDGKRMKLSGLRGKAVLLNFWATYCGPCKIEMPWFVELQKEYGPQGFQIVGVAMDDASNEEIAKFTQDLGVNYPVLIGEEKVGQSYGGVDVLPTTFFLDRNGRIIAREFGLQSRSVFVDHIKQALSQGQAVQARK